MIVPNLVMTHQPWLKRISGESGKVAQKRILQRRLGFPMANLLSEDEVIGNKQPVIQTFFSLVFKYLFLL